jgi:subtilisin family serine protease
MPQHAVNTCWAICAKLQAILWLAVFIAFSHSALAAGQPEFLEGRILIKPKPGHAKAVATLHAKQQALVLGEFPRFGGIQVLKLPPGAGVRQMVEKYQKSGEVEFAEPDYLFHTTAAPNEPNYASGTLWHLHNVNRPGADIHAPAGWDAAHYATNIIVAVIDTGIRYTHQDLVSNIWVNPNEVAGDRRDNDGDGIKDDVYGINASGYPVITADPTDSFGHGTHVAGIIGAVGNNGLGACGVAWSVKLMACKYSTGVEGSAAGAAACIDYALTKGAKVINCSFAGAGFSQTLFDAIDNCRTAGIICVAAAGNEGTNNDAVASYPANFNLDNIVSVAATASDDTLADYSNYGATTVDLAAPGSDIFSTGYGSDSSYSIGSGTSFAAPCVTGALALMRARFPELSYQQIIHRLLWTTDPLPSLAGRCVTGGRLNLDRALNPLAPTLALTPDFAAGKARLQLQGERYQSYILQTTTNFNTWAAISTNTTSLTGTFLYTNILTGGSRFYRAILGQ